MLAMFRYVGGALVLVASAIACVPAGQTQGSPQTPISSSQSEKPFEVLVQYQDGTSEAERVAVRQTIAAKLKERLDSPSGPRGLEVLVVPRSKKLDSIDRVISELRRSKAVRTAEPQQVYRIQTGREQGQSHR